jgi:hypothetical protein
MKKLLFVCLAFVVLALPVFTQTQATTVIRALVGADLTITTTMPSEININPGLTSAILGNVTISSNIAAGGWRIVFNSANGGAMVRNGGTERYPYTLNFGDTIGYNLVTDLTISKNTTQAATTTTVSISYQTAASLSLPAGTYEDTITISLLAP